MSDSTRSATVTYPSGMDSSGDPNRADYTAVRVSGEPGVDIEVRCDGVTVGHITRRTEGDGFGVQQAGNDHAGPMKALDAFKKIRDYCYESRLPATQRRERNRQAHLDEEVDQLFRTLEGRRD